MVFNKAMQKVKHKHLIYALIFLSALFLRMVTAGRLAASGDEAAIFLNLSSTTGNPGHSGSILYQLLTKPLIAMFGDSIQVLRFWIALSGALMTLLPLLFDEILEKQSALVLAILLVLDPFQIANSIQANGNILTVLTLFSAIGFILKSRYGIGILAFTAFLLTGINVFYGFVLIFLLIGMIYLFGQKKDLGKRIQEYYQSIQKSITTIVLVGCIFVFLSFLLQIPYSDFLSHLLQFIQNWNQPYSLGSYPQLFPLALISYLPIIFIGLIPVGKSQIKPEVNIALYLVALVMLFFVAFYPGHSVLDLVWASLPICILAASKIGILIEKYIHYPPKIHIYTLLLMIVLISIAIHFGMLVYKLEFGINLLADLLSVITLLILIVLIIIFLTSSESLELALNAAGIGFLLLILTLQTAFSWRASGLNGSPQAEILWGGYFVDEEIAADIILNADLDTIDLDTDKSVAFLDYDNPAVEWSLDQKFPSEKIQFSLGENKNAVVITESSTGLDDKVLEGYYGQDFVAVSYPLWTWKPFTSLKTSDYWSWLLKRQNEQVHVYHYIWLNKRLFQ